MLRKYVNNVNKVWSKFLFKKPDGTIVNVELVDLPNYRFEDFMDFYMEYYVKREITHQVSGIPKNTAAMAEYKHFYKNILKNPNTSIVVYCEENYTAKPKIVGFSAVKMIKLNEPDYDITQIKTKEMKNYFEVLRSWNNLFPVYDLMRRYNVDRYLDGLGIAVQPGYTGGGMARALFLTRFKICKRLGAPLTGAWMTAAGSAKAAENAGYETLFQISYEELSKNLGVSFENPPPVSKYMVAIP